MQTTVFEGVWPNGTRVRWRLLRWQEHRRARLLLASEPASAYLAAYRTARIEGPEPDRVPAGVVVWIGRHLLENDPFSGTYDPVRRTLEAARAAVRSSYLDAARAVVCHLFHFRWDEVEQLDSSQFFRLVAAAELLTGVPLEPADPSAPPQAGLQRRPERPAGRRS